MEDLVPILWVFVAVGAMIYNAVTKANGKKRRASHAGPAQSEAWPAMELPEEPARPKVPHASESLGRGSERLNPTPARPAAVDAVKRPRAAEEPLAKAEMPENARQKDDATIDEAFDLRRAVIYSELLRPKFDE